METEIDIVLLKKVYEDYKIKLIIHNIEKDYYEGKHDILKMTNYTKKTGRADQRIVVNYIGSMIDKEASYCFGKKATYLSKTEDSEFIDKIIQAYAHFSVKQDYNLALQTNTFKKAYELSYTSKVRDELKFNIRLITPLHGYLYEDDYGDKVFFMNVFNKKFNKDTFIDIITNSEIIHYNEKFKEIAPREQHYFGEVPVGISEIDKSVLDLIKTLNDALNITISDNANLISDYRSAYLTITGGKIDDETFKTIDEMGMVVLPEGAEMKWLMKEINDTYIQNQVNTCVDKIYELTGHINNNEVVPSNNTGQATRSRYTALEQRCQNLIDGVTDCLYFRLRMLSKFLMQTEKKEYLWTDVDIKSTPNIPYDLLTLSNFISQMGENMSLETKLSILPMISNVKLEVDKIKKERLENSINIDVEDTVDTTSKEL